jgi:photosystem II stability/assembly factor-like uncharacterized protein
LLWRGFLGPGTLFRGKDTLLEILSYPVGLVIGLFPVIVDLGPEPGPARLLLDGRQVCEVSSRAPACLIDVGPDPRIRILDLERLDGKGKVVERIRRFINRPTPEGHIRAVGSCDEKKRECEFQLQWAHPGKLDPASLMVSLDGKRIREHVAQVVRVPFPRARIPQVFTVEAVFPDGQRAEYTQVLHGINPETARASLHPIPIELAAPEAEADLEARLRARGWKVRAVEQGEAEILFVLQPRAFSRYSDASRQVSRNPAMFGGALEGLGPLWFVTADESLSLLQTSAVGEHSKRWLPAMMAIASRESVARLRLADAVAAGGYRLGGVPRRRVMVLVLGPHDVFQPDTSAVTPAQALDYLRQAGVPLVVWRTELAIPAKQPAATVGPERSEWPDGEWIRNAHDLPQAITRLRDVIDRQRLVWLEEAAESVDLEPLLPPGITLAGNAAPSVAARTESPMPALSRTVYAVAADPRDPGTLYAGTADGLLRSCDAGQTWARVESGSPGGAFSLAFAGAERSRILAGGSGALFRSAPSARGWSGLGLPTVLSLGVDPSDQSVIYAGTRGRVFKSLDGGLQWSDVSGDVGSFALALAVHPKDPGIVYAGTAGSGVFKSGDGGKTWHEAGRELQATAVRSLAVAVGRPDTVYAGTDGGVFVSADGGNHWSWAGTGLPRAIVYALAIDPRNDARIFAGTSSGLFVTDDGGQVWRRCGGTAAAISSLDFQASTGHLIAGTLGEGVAVLTVENLAPAMPVAAAPEPARPSVREESPLPPGVIPPAAKGPRLPLVVRLTDIRREGKMKVGLLSMTMDTRPLFDAMANAGRPRLEVTVFSRSPAGLTTVRRAGSGGDLDTSVETWSLEIPIGFSVNATQLIVAVVEEQSGAYAVATIDPTR